MPTKEKEGLGLSVWAAVASAFFAATSLTVYARDRWIGSDVEVSQPTKGLMYIDGDIHGVVNIAFETTIINRTAVPDTTKLLYVVVSHNDGISSDRFRFTSYVRPVFYLPGDDTIQCEPLTRCIRKQNITIADSGSRVINVGSYSSLSAYLSFELSGMNCGEKRSTNCNSWKDARSSPLLNQKIHPHFYVNIEFVGDGGKPMECTFSPKGGRTWDQVIERLREKKWASFECV